MEFMLLIFSVVFVDVLCFVCLRPVSCVHNVASLSGLSILDCPFCFSNVYGRFSMSSGLNSNLSCCFIVLECSINQLEVIRGLFVKFVDYLNKF